jgi:hypothetical protein
MVFLRSKTGLWNAPQRKEWFASICMTVDDRWWGLQLMNGPKTTILKGPLTGIGRYGPPSSRTEVSMICSAKTESREVYSLNLYL